jgi:Ca-activated chloride channel family protein
VVAASLVGASLLPTSASAQAPEGAILLIMDASGSMEAEDSDGVPLIDGAKEALRGVVDSLPDGTSVGLRVYGHREPNTDEERGCQDTELISPVEPLDREAMNAAIDGFEPSGFTPIGLSLEEAADDLPPEGPRTIILVSDGEDTCAPPDPCDVAAGLREDGVDLVVETVGFALGSNEEARSQLECIAEAGGGEFRDVETAAELAEQLEVVSLREARRFEAGGVPIEGTPFPDEAPTLELGTTHLDQVQTGETLFYRVEAPAGTVLDARAVRGIVTDPDITKYTTFYVYFSDINGDDYDRFGGGFGAEGSSDFEARPYTGFTVPEDVDEVFVEVEMQAYSDEVGEFPVELTVEDADGATPPGEEPDEEPGEEPDEEPGEEPDEEDTEEPSEEDATVAATSGASSGLPAWALALFAVLGLAVIGLGGAVLVLIKRTSSGGSTG